MNKLLFHKNNFDLFIFLPIVFLIIIGIFGTFSVSMRIDDKFELFNKKTHYLLFYWSNYNFYFFEILSIKNMILFSIILLPFLLFCSFQLYFSSRNQGCQSMDKFFNFSFQPTEILKPTVILSSLLLGRYKSKKDFLLF